MKISVSTYAASVIGAGLVGAVLSHDRKVDDTVMPIPADPKPSGSISQAVSVAKVPQEGIVFVELSFPNRPPIAQVAAEYKRQHTNHIVHLADYSTRQIQGVAMQVSVPKP